ncbi:hypothetical protein RCL1_005217 [Eukaryota sp. TZLM3-RCL]
MVENERNLFGIEALKRNNCVRPITATCIENQSLFVALTHELCRLSRTSLQDQCLVVSDLLLPSQQSRKVMAQLLFTEFKPCSILFVPRQFCTSLAFSQSGHAQYPILSVDTGHDCTTISCVSNSDSFGSELLISPGGRSVMQAMQQLHPTVGNYAPQHRIARREATAQAGADINKEFSFNEFEEAMLVRASCAINTEQHVTHQFRDCGSVSLEVSQRQIDLGPTPQAACEVLFYPNGFKIPLSSIAENIASLLKGADEHCKKNICVSGGLVRVTNFIQRLKFELDKLVRGTMIHALDRSAENSGHEIDRGLRHVAKNNGGWKSGEKFEGRWIGRDEFMQNPDIVVDKCYPIPHWNSSLNIYQAPDTCNVDAYAKVSTPLFSENANLFGAGITAERSA